MEIHGIKNNDLLSHSKVSDLLKPPPRALTQALLQAERLIRNSTSSYATIWIMILAQYAGMGFFALVLFLTPDTSVFLPLGCLLFAVLFHIGALFFKYRYYRKIRNLIVHGRVRTITVIENSIVWTTQVNDTPQRLIRYELDGTGGHLKIYNHAMADEFVGETQVLLHPQIKLLIPITFLIKYKIESKE